MGVLCDGEKKWVDEVPKRLLFLVGGILYVVFGVRGKQLQTTIYSVFTSDPAVFWASFLPTSRVIGCQNAGFSGEAAADGSAQLSVEWNLHCPAGICRTSLSGCTTSSCYELPRRFSTAAAPALSLYLSLSHLGCDPFQPHRPLPLEKDFQSYGSSTLFSCSPEGPRSPANSPEASP